MIQQIALKQTLMNALQSICIFLGLVAVFTPGSTRGALSNYERQIVAATLVLEAAGEGTHGMQAVLNVIYNRAQHKPHRIIGVVAKHGAFSSLNSVTNSRRPDYSPILRRAFKDKAYATAYSLVVALEHGKLRDITGGSDHFYSIHGDRPAWADDMKFVKAIGAHRFYRSPKAPPQYVRL